MTNMVEIANDDDFRRLLEGLDTAGQRAVAAHFVDNVLPLSGDDRIRHVTEIIAKPDAREDDLSMAFHTARTVTVDTHNRCGAECDWQDQAGYFVARAALAAVTPADQLAGGPAFQAAMSSRMARTCMGIGTAEDTAGQERQAQYRILSEFIQSQE